MDIMFRMTPSISWAEFKLRRILRSAARRKERHMSVEVKGLADTIRAAKAAINKASNAAAKMQSSAARLTDTLSQVDTMTKQLDDANADLQGAVGQLSNGGPPLDEPEQVMVRPGEASNP